MTRSEANHRAIHTAVMMLVLVSIIAVVAWCFHCSLQPQTSTPQEYPNLEVKSITLVDEEGNKLISMYCKDGIAYILATNRDKTKRVQITAGTVAIVSLADGPQWTHLEPAGIETSSFRNSGLAKDTK